MVGGWGVFVKKEKSLKFKVGDILILYDMFYSDVGAVFDAMIREASENQTLYSSDPYINDTGTKEEYINGCRRLLQDMYISHHSFSNNNHEIQIGEFIVSGKKVYSHISRLVDYFIVSEIDEEKMKVKTFRDGEHKYQETIRFDYHNNPSMIKLDEVKNVYSYEQAYELWIKWVDENFENIKAGKVNILSL